jgi:integrase
MTTTTTRTRKTATRRRFGRLRKLPSGRWQARYTTPDGVEHSAPDTFATKTDADRYLAAVESDLHRGAWIDPKAGRVTVREWTEAWLPRYVVRKGKPLRPKTVALYEGLLRSTILPTFGTTPLAEVKRSAVEAWLGGLGARGLSPSRIRQAVLLLSAAMDAAVNDDLLLRSPCRGLELPELPEPAPRILTPAEVARLRAAIREPYGVLVDVLAYAGLRIGEALALRRRSVDLLGRRLVVSQSLSEVAGQLTWEAPKNGTARSVTLPRFLADDLAAYLDEHVAADPDALLFTGRTGKPQHYNAWRTWTWDPATLAAELPGVTPHALRATCASWVAEQHGVLEAARRLGHSSASVTSRHYARALVGGDVAVAEGLDGRRGDVPAGVTPERTVSA